MSFDKINYPVMRARGFTLVELMIVVVVIGILSAIAVPQYNDYVRRAARAEAKAILVESAQTLERYFTTNGTYLNASLPASVSPKSGGARYNLSYPAAPTATAFTIQAVPTNGQTADSCGTLTIDQTGNRTPSTCW